MFPFALCFPAHTHPVSGFDFEGIYVIDEKLGRLLFVKFLCPVFPQISWLSAAVKLKYLLTLSYIYCCNKGLYIVNAEI